MNIGQLLAAKGRFGDTMLAHISPEEAQLLKDNGGSGTINPETGLPEFWKFKNFWKSLRDTGETAAVLAGNYYLPGSSLLTSKLTSDGSQQQLNSGIGKVAQIGTGLAGGGAFEGADGSGIPGASNYGGGWTNIANKAGGLFGNATLGTDIANGASNLYNSASTGIGSLLNGAGKSLGLTGEGGLFGTNTAASLGANAVDMQAPSSVGSSFLKDSGLSSAIGVGAGGGGSSYAPIIGALLGGANSYMANEDAQKNLEQAQRNALGVLEPYNASGAAANAKLSDLLGTSGTPMTSEEILAASPQYKFQLEQGNQALDRQQAARGGYFSGAAIKEGQGFAQGLANQTAQQYQDNLARQSGQGLNAAGGAANAYTNIGDAKANATIANSGILNQTLSSLLSGSGAKRPVNIGGQIVYI